MKVTHRNGWRVDFESVQIFSLDLNHKYSTVERASFDLNKTNKQKTQKALCVHRMLWSCFKVCMDPTCAGDQYKSMTAIAIIEDSLPACLTPSQSQLFL